MLTPLPVPAQPENLLIDSEGYLKLVDFGFAKVVHDRCVVRGAFRPNAAPPRAPTTLPALPSSRTYTLCGTPEYLAPELVLGKGHDKGVDYWALGILLYEQVVGYSPFSDQAKNDQIVICRNILRGAVEFPSHVRDKEVRGGGAAELLRAAGGSHSLPPSPHTPLREQLKDLIQRLLTKDVSKRIGCLRGGAGDIREHRFFKSLNFDELYAKSIPAPWKPPLSSPLDTSHFDEYAEDDNVEAYVDDGSGWEKSF